MSGHAPCTASGPDASVVSGLLRRITDGTYDWIERQAQGIGGCSRPVRLKYTTYDTGTGEIVGSSAGDPDGLIYKRCQNRRASKCEPCSFLYRGDQFHIARQGMTAAAGPAHPLYFVTLTAPSFGAVHAIHDHGGPCRINGAPKNAGPGKRCIHGRPTYCLRRHDPDDWNLAQPICPDCYDHRAAVLFNWWVGELWKRFQNTLPRQLARALGLTNKALARAAVVRFYKVYEFQARGVVHAHAVLRIDHPDHHGQGDDQADEDRPHVPPAIDIPEPVLRAAVEATVARIHIAVPAGPNLDQELAWGSQAKVDRIDTTDPHSLHKAAGYLAKYTSKSAGDDFGLGDRPLDPTGARLRGVSAHMQAMIAAAHDLAATVPDLYDGDGQLVDEGYTRITRYTHQLGFHSHYASKSRRYSTTLTVLRHRRTLYQRAKHRELRGLPPDEPADELDQGDELVTDWTYEGTGWLTKGDAALADSIAARTREGRQAAREAA
jgi:hypothetical protein